MNRSPSTLITCITLACLLLVASCTQQPEAPTDNFPILTGDYLGQKPPGLEPEVFAPGIISTGLHERDVAITPDGNEFYFCASMGGINTIFHTKQIDGHWTPPEVVPFASRYLDFEPALSYDGNRLFFLSTRPTPGEEPGNQDIWVVDRTAKGWGEPSNLGPPVNSDAPEFFPSLTMDGTIYFTRQEKPGQEAIFRSRLVDGKYQAAEKLPAQVNSGQSHFNAFIAHDESYIIVPTAGRDDTLGGPDYYIVFRSEDDTWSEPINMGEKINTATGREWSPYVTRDGKYFFFMSSRTPMTAPDTPWPATFEEIQKLGNSPQNGNSDIWWVDASIIEKMR